jgi:hypothetical protein
MSSPTPEQISILAYQLWRERGCPHGSPEEDWKHAEEILASPNKRDVFMRATMGEHIEEIDPQDVREKNVPTRSS